MNTNNGKVILVKRADRDLAYILKTDDFGKVPKNIPVHWTKKDIISPAPISFDIVEAYLKSKELNYEQQCNYEKEILRLKGNETINSILDFFREAEEIQSLRDRYLNEEEDKKVEDWNRKLRTLLEEYG